MVALPAFVPTTTSTFICRYNPDPDTNSYRWKKLSINKINDLTTAAQAGHP